MFYKKIINLLKKFNDILETVLSINGQDYTFKTKVNSYKAEPKSYIK